MQEFKPRVLLAKNWGKATCGFADAAKKEKNNPCCHGAYDNAVIEEKRSGQFKDIPSNSTKYKHYKACPVNIGGFQSYYPSTKNQDSATIYESEHNKNDQVILGVLSTFGAPTVTLAVQNNANNLDKDAKHEKTYPGGSGWWARIMKSGDKVTRIFKDLRMTFGATQKDTENPIGAQWLSVQFVSTNTHTHTHIQHIHILPYIYIIINIYYIVHVIQFFF